jgi:hypothetical protein
MFGAAPTIRWSKELLESSRKGMLMTKDEALRTLNTRLNEAENAGDRDFLAAVLAPELAFLRADGKTVDDGGRFLQKVAPREPCELTFEHIEVLGTRAIVRCVVACGKNRFHNVRLFVELEGQWKLLGWANERLTNSTS